ncbi:hypothetical protein ACQCVH_22340 [Bacillus infantis]|uniref:hypothetical protein n=1 Tax=Bacillus infantis TaxID=324767 RepID=UPI003CF66950
MTNNLFFQNFIESLCRWSKEVTEKSIIKRTLVIVGFDLGLDVDEKDDIEKIKKRLQFLIQDTGLSEEFLILSLADRVSYHLKNELSTHGQAIILNEKLISRNKESGMGPRTEVMESTLNILKDRKYILNQEYAIDRWEKIKAETFTLANIRKWNDLSSEIEEWKLSK